MPNAIDNTLQMLYDALNRPRYAVGNVMAGKPVAALSTLNPFTPLRPEDRREPAQAVGATGIAGRAMNLALDPLLWLGPLGIKKVKAKQPELDRLVKLHATVRGAFDEAWKVAPGAAPARPDQIQNVKMFLDRFPLARSLKNEVVAPALRGFKVDQRGFKTAVPAMTESQLAALETRLMQSYDAIKTPASELNRRVQLQQGLMNRLSALPKAGANDLPIDEVEYRAIQDALRKAGLGQDPDVWGATMQERPPVGQQVVETGRGPGFRRLRKDQYQVALSDIATTAASMPPLAQDVGAISRTLFGMRSTGQGTDFGQLFHEAELNTHSASTAWAKKYARILDKVGPAGSDAEKRVLWASQGKKPDGTPFRINDLTNQAERLAALELKRFNRALGRNVLRLPPEQIVEMERQGGYFPHYATRELRQLLAQGNEVPVDFLGGVENPNVWMPNLLKRTDGMTDYVQDRSALNLYAHYAARKKFLEPVMQRARMALPSMPGIQAETINEVIGALSGKPSAAIHAMTNSLKSIGWKNVTPGDVTNAMRKITSHVYLGGLGGNIGSPVRNLTQSVHSIAEIGPDWHKRGVERLATDEGRRLVEQSGILGEWVGVDAIAASQGTVYQKAQKILMWPFQKSEWFNRGSTYLGAYEKARFAGLPTDAARAFARDVVEKTQFGFLKSTLGKPFRDPAYKPLVQFMTFPAKTVEMMHSWFREKRWDAFARYLAATALVVHAGRQALGIDLSNAFGTGILPAGMAPVPQAALDVMKGDWENLKRKAPLLVPGGVQGKRLFDFVQTVRNGWEQRDSRGRLIRDVTPADAVRKALGLMPDTQRVEQEHIDKLMTLRDKYQEARQKAIAAILDGSPRDAELIVGAFTAETGIPIRITPSAIRAAYRKANESAEERIRHSLPRPVQAGAQRQIGVM